MKKEMTIEEIRSQFESEWVLIENPKTDEGLAVLGGKVLCHSRDRDETYRKAAARRPKRSAIVYTGTIPEETALFCELSVRSWTRHLTMKRKKEPQLPPDGFMCLEGTRRIPQSFRPCCDEFDAHTRSCVRDVRYEWWPKLKIWVIPILEEAGGGGIAIGFCPHCGAKLKGSGKTGRYIEL